MKHNAKILAVALVLATFTIALDEPAGTKLWEFYVGQPVQSSAALGADGTVYFGADNGKLYAFTPEGSGKWEFPTGDALVASPAIASDGTVYFASADSHLYAVGADGVEKWRYCSNGKIVASPALGANGLIVFGTMQKTLFAVDSEGAKRWELALEDAVVSSPAVGRDGTIYVASLNGVLHAVDPAGKLKWKFKASDKVNSSPAIGADGTIYFGAFDGHVYAVRPNGQKRWTFATGAAVRGSAAIGPDGVVYIGSDDRKLYAFSAEGLKLWSYNTGGWVRSTPAVSSDGTIYFGSYDNGLHAVRRSGAKVWEFSTDSAISASPALAPDGALYFGGWNKRFYAVKGAAGLAPNAWAKFRGDARQTAAQLEFAPMQFAKPTERPAFPVEEPPSIGASSKAIAAEEFARAQAARELAMAAKKESAARNKALAIPAPVASSVAMDTTSEARRIAAAEADANRRMLADNAKVLKEAELARKVQSEADRRRALSAADQARLAKAAAGQRAQATAQAQTAENKRALKEADDARKLQMTADARRATEAAEQARLAMVAADRQARATELAEIAESKRVFEESKRLLKDAEAARKLQAAEEARQATAATELARLNKREADQRAAAERALELAETKRLQAEAQAIEAAQRQAAKEAAQLAEAERRRIEAERQKWEPVQPGFFQRLFGAAAPQPAVIAETNAPAPVLIPEPVLLVAPSVTLAATDASETARLKAEAKAIEAAQRQAVKEAAQLAEAERRRIEAERQKWEPVRPGFFQRLFGAADPQPAVSAETKAADPVPIPVPVTLAVTDAAETARLQAAAQATEAAGRKAAEETARYAKVQAEADRRSSMETARTAKLQNDTERKALEAAANRELAAAKAKAEADAKTAAEADRYRQREQEIARKVHAESEKAARGEEVRQAREASQAQAAERRRIEAERQKWEPVSGGFFRRLFGVGPATAEPPAVPAAPVQVATAPAPAPQPIAPRSAITPQVSSPTPVVFTPIIAAPNTPLTYISDSSELARPTVAATPSPSFFTPNQPSADPLAEQIELIKQRAAAAQAQSQPQFTQPVALAQPVVAQPTYQQPGYAQPVFAQPIYHQGAAPQQFAPPEAQAGGEQPQAQAESPGFWSRVGNFFVRRKTDQQSASQNAQQPQRAVAPWPPGNNIVVRDPRATPQLPPGMAPGGVTATNFPRVQYAPVNSQNNGFLARAMAMQTNLAGMPQAPAPPREVREMRPTRVGDQGLTTELAGGPAIELMQGRAKAPLRVYVTGAGRVMPELNGAELEVGQTYTLEAQPARGAVFLGWSGSIEAQEPVVRFVMRTGTILSANFQFGYNLERELPEVVVHSPADGERLNSPAFTLHGTARDNLSIARVEVSVNQGPWEPAQGTDNWVFKGAARPGPNTMRVRATDQAGNESLPLVRSLHFSIPSALAVRVNGAGTVEPDWNSRQLEVGSTYELRATPAPGHVFTGWSGGASGAAPILQFTMQPNLVLEANFASRIASLARGRFTGLVYPTNSLAPSKCGFFQLDVAADGAFSGFLRQGIATHALSGRFDLNGQANALVTRAGQPTLSVALQLDTAAGERLMGRFTDEGQPVELFGYRQVFDGQSASTPLAGRYTFVTPTATNSPNSPAGDAFGELVVDSAGRASLAGELPDGTPVRHEAGVGRNGLWPLHVPLAGGRGMLLGWITITNHAQLDVYGEVIWHKPLSPQDRYYPGGFSIRRQLFGARYTATATAVTSGDRRIGGMLSGGNLNKVILDQSGMPMNSSSPNYQTLQQFIWRFRPDTGFVEGTFIHPATQQETTFRGAFLQKLGWTSGYFLGQNHSGVVHLQLPL